MNENIDLVRRLVEEQANQDSMSLYDLIYSEDVIIHGPATDQVVKGLSDLKKIQTSYKETYPRTRFKIEDLFAIGNRVFVRWTGEGAYEKKTKPKSTFKIWGLTIYQISQGKISEVWQFWDRLGLIEQLGEIQIYKETSTPDLLISLGMEKYIKGAKTLSQRERQCLLCLLEGKTAKETAQLYGLSPRTVETYFQKSKEKLSCYTKRDLFTAARILVKLELL